MKNEAHHTLIPLIVSIVNDTKEVAPIAPTSIFHFFSKKMKNKAVMLEYDEEGLQIDICVALYEHVPILATCLLLQQYVKEQIEFLTGLHVKRICIKVRAVVKIL